MLDKVKQKKYEKKKNNKIVFCSIPFCDYNGDGVLLYFYNVFSQSPPHADSL